VAWALLRKVSHAIAGRATPGAQRGTCVAPDVQLLRRVRVHVAPLDVPPQGIRFTHLIEQGLAKHPAVVLVPALPVSKTQQRCLL